jgi:antitoxin HigA-1
MNGRDFPPVHPGEILLEEFLKPMGISQYRLAESIRVPARRINEIVLEKRGITADTALRLSRFFGNSAQFLMNLQTRYELESARELSASSIDREVRPHAAA